MLFRSLQNKLNEEQTQRKKEIKKQLEKDRNSYIATTVSKWRAKTNYELLGWLLASIIGLIVLLWKSQWNIENAINLYKELKANFLISQC